MAGYRVVDLEAAVGVAETDRVVVPVAVVDPEVEATAAARVAESAPETLAVGWAEVATVAGWEGADWVD